MYVFPVLWNMAYIFKPFLPWERLMMESYYFIKTKCAMVLLWFGETKFIFGENTYYHTNSPNWIKAQASWYNSLYIDMSMYSDTLDLFRTSQYLLLMSSTYHRSNKYQLSYLWIDSTWNGTHNLETSRQAHWPLHLLGGLMLNIVYLNI